MQYIISPCSPTVGQVLQPGGPRSQHLVLLFHHRGVDDDVVDGWLLGEMVDDVISNNGESM